MTGFYVVCMWMGVEPSVSHFQTCFYSRNTNPFHFYLTSHSKEKKATFLSLGPEKITAWESYYVFIEEPANRPFNFLPLAESLLPQIDSASLQPDPEIMQLKKNLFQGYFQIGEVV